MDVELTGLIDINNIVDEENTIITLNFKVEIISGEIKIKADEVMDVRWFTYGEILNMKDNLRRADMLLPSLKSVESNNIKPLDNIHVIR